MRLTRHADYAFRALMTLGLRQDEVCTVRDIAAAYGISEAHLTKVVHRLGVEGIVHTVRGRGGGLRLALPPEAINLGRVLRLVEDDLHIVECFDRERNRCPIAGSCHLSDVLGEALDAFLGVLDKHSLADLLVSRRALLERLGMQRPGGLRRKSRRTSA